ncbi:prepilin-type N-terminal cleavage/methylation domain-containing protein [Trabulsiella odontotermitis]|uniref:prepilin-type N-terminal cleavage/methylation domain-containing protein n=1 Tax=Trabulsiella odontotermitis TaxID=379893 RepID=UPI003AC1563B
MSDTLNRRHGFSLPEVILAMALMITVVSALAGYQRGLATGFTQLAQYRQLWRNAWQQTQWVPGEMPEGWKVNRVQTSAQRCVSISVTITSPVGRQSQMTRLHCPAGQ